MWDWAHFKAEGYLSHLRRSGKLSGRLLLASFAMIVHMLVPFWQQPKWLCADQVASIISEGMEKRDD